MKAAIDSNALFDVLAGEEIPASAAWVALSTATASGPTVICPVVYAELATGFDGEQELSHFLADLGVQVEGFSMEGLQAAARGWRAYVRRRGRDVQCSRCGHRFDLQCPACQAPISWRQHLISDFLIGGHAFAQADLLITRDTGYYRSYFPQLKLVVPGSEAPSPP